VDITAALADQGADASTMRKFLELGEEGMTKARDAIASGSFRIERTAIRLLAPIYDAEKVLCVGMNYVDHCTEQGMPIPKEPLFFSKLPSCIIAPGEAIVRPPETEALDFEVELAIVIGKGGHRIPKDRAMEHVAGYTVAHDVSARDWQLKRNGGQWLLGKAFPTFAPLGPAIVTPDSLPGGHAHGLDLSCTLNGDTVQSSNTEQLVFKTEDIVSWASCFCRLRPGDVIQTGTPPGVGCFRDPPLWMKGGDTVTCTIEGIGSITNPVVDEEGVDVKAPSGSP
jgi:2-keto-4-pentenoate hydratase/2-oxohepta-3-ene-1,7-dioic acid hydratase in catechol pathway